MWGGDTGAVKEEGVIKMPWGAPGDFIHPWNCAEVASELSHWKMGGWSIYLLTSIPAGWIFPGGGNWEKTSRTSWWRLFTGRGTWSCPPWLCWNWVGWGAGLRRNVSHVSALFACAYVYMCACTCVCAYACVSVLMHRSHKHWVGHSGGFLLLTGPQMVFVYLLWRVILSACPWEAQLLQITGTWWMFGACRSGCLGWVW